MLIIYSIVMLVGFIIFGICSYFDSHRTNSSEAVAATGPVIDNYGVKPEAAARQEVAAAKSKGSGLFSFLVQKKQNGKEMVKVSVVPEVTPKEELQDIKQALVDKLDQKCVKLEQILEEKNRILAQLQKDLEDERAHRGEFESLRAILQQQIDDLKAQNRNLKDEFDRILQENLRLQTGMTMASDPALKNGYLADSQKGSLPVDKSGSQSGPGGQGSPDIISENLQNMDVGKITLEPGERDDSDSSLGLKDIFDEEDKSKGSAS